MANIEFAGFVFDDAGDAINGATVNLYDRNDTATVRATTTTNSSGYWTISHATEGRFDIEVVSGSSKRRRKYDDAIQYTEVEVGNLLLRNPANTFKYDIVPAAITADRTLTLPLITGSDTLVSEGVSRVFTADMTFNDNVNLTLGTGGDVDIDYDGTDLIINARVVGTGNVDFRQHLTWGAGVAITAGDYAIGRDADGTNQLHLNVPTGASYEFSINDTAELVLNATNIQPGADDGLALGVSGTAFSDLFLASGAVVNFNAGDVTLTHSANVLTLAGGDFHLDGDLDFQGAQSITTTSGNLTLASAAGSNVLIGDGTSILRVMGGTAQVGINANPSSGIVMEIGGTNTAVNARGLRISATQQPSAGSAVSAALVLDSAFQPGGSDTFSHIAQLILDEPSITIGSATVTVAATLAIRSAPTEGGTNSYITLGSADADMNLIHVNVTGNPIYSWDESEYRFSFSHGIGVIGRIIGAKGADVASADEMALGTDGNYFDITGTTTINHITNTAWVAGAIVVLQFDASVTVTHNAGSPAGTEASILLSGAADFSATADDTLTLVYDGTTFREVSRTVI